MVQLDLSAAGEAPPERRAARQAAILALAFALTLGAFALAFLLGAAYFQARRSAAHETRLRHMLMQAPHVDQVSAGLRDDGSPLLAAPRGEAELRALVARYRGQKGDEILAKGRRFARTRVFQASDMVYFIFFDEAGTMRDFTYVSA